MLLLRVVNDVVGAVELVVVVIISGSLLGVVRCLCFCVFTELVFVILMSSDMAVIRRARNMSCGVACGWKAVVALLDCLRRFHVAFFERVCGSFLHNSLGVRFCFASWALNMCIAIGVRAEKKRVFICVGCLLHCIVGVLGLPKLCPMLLGVELSV